MPDFSKMFAKRLEEDNYKSIFSFLQGKTTFKDLGKNSQNVLNGLEKPEDNRTFTEQEQLYELKQKLVATKWLSPDTDMWDKLETTYRTFMLGKEARNRFFHAQDQFRTDSGESYKPYKITKEENYLAYQESGKTKWMARAEKDFKEDLRLGNLDEYKDTMPMSEIKHKYIEGYTEWLNDPSNLSKEAIEYRRDLGIKEVEMSELPKTFKPMEEPLLEPKQFGTLVNRFIEENNIDFTFGVKGIQVNATKFSKWVEKQGSGTIESIGLNLASGLVITEALSFIAKHSHMNAKQEHILNFTVTESLAGMQLALADSEFGVIIGVGALMAGPAIELINWLKSPGKRRVDNDNPEKIYGSQFARVRSEDSQGRPTWFPAILASKDEWTGLGSTEQNIRLNYGRLEDLHWRFNKNGTFSPFFENARYKMVNATNKDLGQNASEKLRLKYDPLRDYSLLTNDETGKLFGKLMRGEDLSEFKEKVDDRSKQPKYVQELTSYRDDMEYIRTFDLGGEKVGRGLNPADRQIRRQFEHSVMADPKYIEQSGIYFEMLDDTKYKKGYTQYKSKLKENTALLSYFQTRMQDLLRSQKIAGQESGFLKSLKGGEFNYSDDHFNYLLYSLNTGFSPAQSLDELKTQNTNTQTRLDLKWYEKNYIQQKNIVRYFANKLSQRALGSDIVKKAMYPHQDTYSHDKPPYTKTGLNYAGILNAGGTLRLQQVDHTSVFGNPPGPWSNSDEQTIPSWLFKDPYRGKIYGPKHFDYKIESEKYKSLMEREFLNPLFARSKFVPSELFKQSNPRYFEKQKLPERVDLETADEKRARLAKIKQARLLTIRKSPKKIKVPTLFKDPTQRSAKQDTVVKQKLDLSKIKSTLFGHGKIQKGKTKFDKQPDQKGKDSKKKALEKQRYKEKFRRSETIQLEQQRILSDEFAKKRKHHGMTYYQYREFIRDHSGKTPDEVYKQGQWKVKTVIPKVPIKSTIPKSDPYSALREYLREQHNINIPKNQPITTKQFPWLAMTAEGTPALYGDEVLHDKLKLGDAFRVVTTNTGIVHKAYDPSKIQPKFFKPHETSVVSSY